MSFICEQKHEWMVDDVYFTLRIRIQHSLGWGEGGVGAYIGTRNILRFRIKDDLTATIWLESALTLLQVKVVLVTRGHQPAWQAEYVRNCWLFLSLRYHLTPTSTTIHHREIFLSLFVLQISSCCFFLSNSLMEFIYIAFNLGLKGFFSLKKYVEKYPSFHYFFYQLTGLS